MNTVKFKKETTGASVQFGSGTPQPIVVDGTIRVAAEYGSINVYSGNKRLLTVDTGNTIYINDVQVTGVGASPALSDAAIATSLTNSVFNGGTGGSVTTDATPTASSTNPVQSGGVLRSLSAKVNKSTDLHHKTIFLAPLNVNTTPTVGSGTATFTRNFDAAILLSTGLYGNAAHNVAAFSWDDQIGNSRYQSRGVQITSPIFGANNTANRDLTQAEWVKTSCTAAKTGTGVDGAANSCSLLTATGANATALFSITAASSTKTFSAFIKRSTGGGRIWLTRDGGTTLVDVTPFITTGAFVRVSMTSAGLNPVVGFKIENSGDVFIIDAVNDTDTAVTRDPLINNSHDRRVDTLSFTGVIAAVAGKRYHMSAEVIVRDATNVPFLRMTDGSANEVTVSMQNGNCFSISTKSGGTLRYNRNSSNQSERIGLPEGTRIKFGIAWGLGQAAAIVNDSLFYLSDNSTLASSGAALPDPVSMTQLQISGGGDFQNFKVVELGGRNLVMEGDSVMANIQDSYAKAYVDFKEWCVHPHATGGSIITDVTARVGVNITPAYWANAVDNLLFLWIGTNTLANNVSAATALSQLQTLVTTILAGNIGWRIKLVTVLPSRTAGLTGITAAAFATAATVYNAGLSAITGIAGVIDVASMAESQDATNTTYFVDGIHPTPYWYELAKKTFMDALYS